MRKILVLRGGALGDFIVTLPALAALRRRWPAARIELAGNATAAALAHNRGWLDAVHSQHEARWSALFGREPLPSGFASWLGEFDLVVNYWPAPEGELDRQFPARAGQRFLSAGAMPARAPAAAHYCAPLRELGIEVQDYFVPLTPAPAALRASAGMVPPLTRRATEDLIAVHPGSGSPKKNWPMERWRELIAQLRAPVLLVLGEAELDRWGTATGSAETPNCRLACNLPLEDLAARLSRCRLFVGHDSGVSHLAAACGVPSVLLFGPTDPAMWAPPAPHVQVLRHAPSLDSLSGVAVHAAIASALK